MIILIDNYDSFSFNLYQLLGGLGTEIRVIRNDAITVEELTTLHPEGIILSPGPGKPADAGICEEIIRKLSGVVPLLGVCLGHQAICEAFGAIVGPASRLVHGKASCVDLDTSSDLFERLPRRIKVARYHSLSAYKASIPSCLHVTARTADDDQEIMAVQHIEHPTFGVQFHPESILTPEGEHIARNFLSVCQQWRNKTDRNKA